MIKAGIIGATGYAGNELVRILMGHKEVEIKWYGSRSYIDKKYAEVYQNMFEIVDDVCLDDNMDELASQVDVIFTATPQGFLAGVLTEDILNKVKIIDLSADFRIKDVSVYEKWYKIEHKSPQFIEEAVYGLCEINRDKVKGARLIANPGCYTTCSILTAYPLVKEGLIDPNTLIIDAKSGTSGAGRGAKLPNLFCEVNENMKAYGVTNHRHTPEIEEQLGYAAGKEIVVNFTPHLVPMNRGILATEYAALVKKADGSLPSYEEVKVNKKVYADSFAIQYQNTDPFSARPMVESYGTKGYIIQNPPALPLTQEEMDDVYALPYTEKVHPMYEKLGGIPALEEIKFSLTSNRGCFGGCNFCALTFHQGRILQTRSHESLIEEATRMTNDPEFKGYIHDVGGPTADFRQPSCQKQLTKGVCKNKQCLFPTPCKNLTVDHSDYVSLLRKLRKIPGVKKVFIRSGVRFDYVVADRDKTFLRELVEHHVSGQLRVAPEHVSDQVLKYMGKPSHSVYQQFLKEYDAANRQTGKQQYAVPYFMSSHPGCTMKEAVKLAEYVRDLGFTPEQVQDFYPTPSTLSTCMYYTGIHPLTGEKVYVPKNPHEKAIQRALMQYKNPANRELVLEGLKMTGRMDLVGYGPKCLIRPLRENHGGQQHTQGSSRNAKNSRNSKNNKNSSASAKKNTIRNIHKKNSRGGRK